MKRFKYVVVPLFLVLAIGVFALRSEIQSQWDRYREKQQIEDCYIGQRAPDINGVTQFNRTWCLSALRGKVVVMDFTSMGCIHCGPAHQMLEGIEAEYLGKDVVFVSISLDEDFKDYNRSIVRRNIKWPLIWEPPDIYIHKAARAYSIFALPSIWIIGRDGRVVESHAHRFAPYIKLKINQALNDKKAG